jgi:quercetin dioxygenase-like cupin family protein
LNIVASKVKPFGGVTMSTNGNNLDPEKQPALARVDRYQEWRKREGAPLVGGIYIKDMKAVEVGPWPRKGDGVKGALCYLDGDDEADEHVVELPPGGATAPLRHLYTEAIYVVSGHGSTAVWRGDYGAKQTFEWGPGSYFVLPTNASHQFFNASLTRPARWFSVTDLPQLLRQWASEDFIFNNPYDFTDRYAGGAEYFTAEAKLYKGRVWETNFIPDIKKLPLYEWKSRGGGGKNAFMVMGAGMMESHVSSFPSGHYKKGHRHGPGAHLYITEGEGYVLTQRGNEPRIRCDWQEGSLYLSGAGAGIWLHQHFNVGATPATYLVMNQGISRKHASNRWQASESTVLRGGEVSGKEGGRQVEYEDEARDIHEIFEAELKKHGITCKMKKMVPWCTGEAGAESVKAHYLDEHGEVV